MSSFCFIYLEQPGGQHKIPSRVQVGSTVEYNTQACSKVRLTYLSTLPTSTGARYSLLLGAVHLVRTRWRISLKGKSFPRLCSHVQPPLFFNGDENSSP